MAATMASRRSSKLLEKLLFPARGVVPQYPSAAACAARSFNTSADARDLSSPREEHALDVERRDDRAVSRRRDRDPFSGFFSDVLDPIFPGRSLSQVLNLMDQLMDSPVAAASRGMGMLGGPRRGWDVREDDDALYLRIDMPGLGREHVKVLVEQNTLVIKGEGENPSPSEGEEETGRRYSSRIDLPSKLYKLDEIKADMKNGVLKVVVPKVKEEERKDVVQISVD